MSDTPLTSTVSGLSDRRLLEQIKEMVDREQHLTLVIVDHLREIEARSLHLKRGFGSLFDYTVTELGYTASAAWRRIQAMHLSCQIDGVRERLEDGTLSLTAAAQLQTAFDRNRRQATVAAGAEAQAPSVPVLDVSARKALVEDAAGKSAREVERMLTSVDPRLVTPREKVRPLGEGKWELKAVIDEGCERGLEELKRLLSHTNPSMTYGELVGRLVQEGLDRHDPGRRGSRRDAASAPKSQGKSAANGTSVPKSEGQPAATDGSAPKSQAKPAPNAPSPAKSPTKPVRAITSAPKERGASRAIPQPIKRQVWQRDQGRCRYTDQVTGRRCTSRHLLQIDHIRPYALSGSTDPANLRLLCAAHHRHRHRHRHRHAARAAPGEPAS